MLINSYKYFLFTMIARATSPNQQSFLHPLYKKYLSALRFAIFATYSLTFHFFDLS